MATFSYENKEIPSLQELFFGLKLLSSLCVCVCGLVCICVRVQSCDVHLVTVRSCSFKNEASDGAHNRVPNVIPLIEMPLNNRTRVHTNTHTHTNPPNSHTRIHALSYDRGKSFDLSD